MFINFTSAVIAEGTPFGHRRFPLAKVNPVSVNFKKKEFMSNGFRRSNTICDCFEKHKWQSFTRWGEG